VLHGDVPILVDTGPGVERESYLAALQSVIDPADLRCIWLTHPDADHTGALSQLLADYPDLKVITTVLGVGILSTSDPLPMDRVHLVNPGQSITLGSRTLTAFRPPTFDNPSTTGFFDVSSKVLFPADCFGALLQDIPENAADLTDADLRDGQVVWATIDSPWLHQIERGMLARELDTVASLEPSLILSSHLPAAPGHLLGRFLTSLAEVPDAAPFVGPDQVALEAMLAQMHTGAQ
jgi:flavorubredoxin